MPITAPVVSATSSAQTIPTVQVFDYVLSGGVAQKNVTVRCVLDGNAQTTIAPLTLIEPLDVQTTTDGNGYFSFTLVPTDNMQPANCTYTIVTPFRTYQITVPSGGPWQTTAVGIIVNTPVALAPAVTGLTGPLTIASGGLTVSSGGATIAGGLTISSGTFTIATGGFTMAGPLTLTAAASQIIPGATSFSVRNTGNTNDNLLVTDAGLVTARAGLVVTAGGLTVSAGGATITGAVVVTGALTVSSLLTIQSNGLVIQAGGATITGTVTASALVTAQAGLTVSSGNLNITSGNITMGAAASQIVPGATGLFFENHTNSATNLSLPDNGQAVFRNGLALLGGTKDVGAGTIGYAAVTADQGTFTTQTDLTSLTLTFTAAAGRRYKITAYVAFQSSVTDDYIQLLIIDTAGSTTIAGPFWCIGLATDQVQGMAMAVLVPGAGAKTYKLAASRAVGAGNITMKASATNPAFILIEDIGT